MFLLDFLCYVFFSSRRRHTRCALVTGVQTCALPICSPPKWLGAADLGRNDRSIADGERLATVLDGKPSDIQLFHASRALFVNRAQHEWQVNSHADRKSVVQGKSVSVRGDLGGRLIIKQKKQSKYKRKPNDKKK